MLRELATAAIFLATYMGVAIGRIPYLRIDRAGIALVGGAFMLAIGAISPQEAYRAIDLDTLALLLGMMIVVGHLRLSGFFRLAVRWALNHAHSQPVFLVALVAATGLLSAFLVNDAICLVMAPLAIEMTRTLKREPAPYLIAVAMASNVGSVATITGNPQNMIIGAFSQIRYVDFAAALAPIALAGLAIVVLLVVAFSPREFFPFRRLGVASAKVRVNRPQVFKATAVAALVIGLFFAGAPVGETALIGAALLLVTRAIKPQKVYREIDGPLLLLFAGLFVVVAAAEKVLLTDQMLEFARAAHLDNVWTLTALTAELSNIISNVPAVLAMKPFVASLPNPHRIWLIVAMASTLAGNLTLVGSVANLIVAEKARQAGILISFWRYAAIGAPVTLLTLAIGACRLGSG
jgi:Na+/H+ antiporter NhaD/arsenite permease-like protein